VRRTPVLIRTKTAGSQHLRCPSSHTWAGLKTSQFATPWRCLPSFARIATGFQSRNQISNFAYIMRRVMIEQSIEHVTSIDANHLFRIHVGEVGKRLSKRRTPGVAAPSLGAEKETAGRVQEAVNQLRRQGRKVTLVAIRDTIRSTYGISISTSTIKRNDLAYKAVKSRMRWSCCPTARSSCTSISVFTPTAYWTVMC